MHQTNNSIAIIGAGIGGLAAALRLSDAGLDVTVFDSAGDVGGKMRTVASAAGPIDAGPTVFTMRHVFEKLFDDVGENLSEYLTLTPANILARHYWPDGSMLDLMANPDETAANIRTWGGARAENDYRAFAERARILYEAFDLPMMQAAIPSQKELTRQVMSRPSLIQKMAPWFTLMKSLRHSFKDKRLAQLYGRYATYVGGDPFASPALLSLISHSEALGVYVVKGGMHQLAQTLRTLAQARGATFKLNTHIKQINVQNDHICGLTTDDGTRYDAARALFNGDPKALQDGLLGKSSRAAVPNKQVQTRSLSAHVHTFAAKPTGPDLSHHTIFFGDDPKAEFGPIRSGQLPHDPTLYICAQDRAGGAQPTGIERFEIIMNAPPTTDTTASQREITQCQTLVFNTLARFGLTFTPKPTPHSLTPPATFNRLFPASHGSLYGQSPHGLCAVGRGDIDGPCFDIDVPPNGYAWWYIDGISHCGTRAISIIGFIGSVFSPWYRWSGRKSPRNHCCINVATYGPGGRFTMTDRGESALRTSQDVFEVGPSKMTWIGDKLVIDINEMGAPPMVGPVRGKVTLTPKFVTNLEVPLTPSGTHVWRPFAPSANIDVQLEADGWQWDGHGYFDANFGTAALEDDFSYWTWGRYPHSKGSVCFYDADRRDGSTLDVGLLFQNDGEVQLLNSPPKVAMKRSLWQVRRETRADAGYKPVQVKGMLDAPFYSRSAVKTQFAGEEVVGVHEALDLNRFRSKIVKPMLACRVPRRAKWRFDTPPVE